MAQQAVLGSDFCICAQRSFLAELRQSYKTLGIQTGGGCVQGKYLTLCYLSSFLQSHLETHTAESESFQLQGDTNLIQVGFHKNNPNQQTRKEGLSKQSRLGGSHLVSSCGWTPNALWWERKACVGVSEDQRLLAAFEASDLQLEEQNPMV